MGEIHEKEVNRIAVSGVSQGLGGGAANHRDSTGGFGGGKAASELREGAGADQGRSVAGGASGMDSVRKLESAPRVRTGNGNFAGTPSVHGQEVGAGSGQKKGIQGMSHTMAVAQQKGGDGKTASVVHLAFDYFERGYRVAVVDLDTQGNASHTLENFASGYVASAMFSQSFDNISAHFANLPETPLLSLIASDKDLADMEELSFDEAAECFKSNIEALARAGFDIILIDNAPSLGTTLAASLYAADSVISPIKPEYYSIMGIKKMLTVIANVRKINTKLQFLGMVPSMVDMRNPSHVQNLAELQEAYPNLMIPLSIGLRSSIADALADQMPVWKIKKTSARKAAQEMRALAAYAIEKMEIQ
jgi:chromosome partitioning protein